MAFNWARMAAGQKVTNAQLEEEAKAKVERAETIRLQQAQAEMQQAHAKMQQAQAAMQQYREQQVNSQLAKAGKDKELAQLQQLREAIEEAEKKKLAESYTREQGHWCTHTYRARFADSSRYLSAGERKYPKGCNERALRWVQEWFTVWGDKLKEAKTLGELEQLYYDHWCPWLIRKFYRTANAVESYIKYHNPSTDAGAPPVLSSNVQYKLIQDWVTSVEEPGCRPWTEYDIWTPAKNITWENVLHIMRKYSGAFENGIIDIAGHHKNPQSKITWVVELSPYETIEFESKPLTRAQQDRMRDDDW
jgi:hypothetical protein